MPSFVLYHNPRCSTSRRALKLLAERGIHPDIVLYLETPPSAAALKELLKKLGLEPRALLRTKEPLHKELGLDDPKKSDAEIIRAMAENPILIECPILVASNRAILGRPAERVLELV